MNGEPIEPLSREERIQRIKEIVQANLLKKKTPKTESVLVPELDTFGKLERAYRNWKRTSRRKAT